MAFCLYRLMARLILIFVYITYKPVIVSLKLPLIYMGTTEIKSQTKTSKQIIYFCCSGETKIGFQVDRTI